MQCHQGRASGASVDASIQKAGLTDDDTVSADLGFTNIHYFAAAVSQFGTEASGGYQYPDKRYDAKTDHTQAKAGPYQPGLLYRARRGTPCSPNIDRADAR